MKKARWFAALASLAIICFTVRVGAQVMPPMPGLVPASEADFKGTNEVPGSGALTASQETGVLAESGSSDATIAEEDALDEPLAEEQSVPCEPGMVYWESRLALGALLDGTPADLDGTGDRAIWFALFPGTQEFPIGAEMSGIKWDYNARGTVGLVMSMSPWPIWDWSGDAPSSDQDYVVIAESFLKDQGALIQLNGRFGELTVARVVHDAAGWKVVFGQVYEGLPVIGARITVWGNDRYGDVFGMQSSYVPNLAVDTQPAVPAADVYDIIADDTEHWFLGGRQFHTDSGPELVVAHTSEDFCSGTLLWRTRLTTSGGVSAECLIDASRGNIHGCMILDGDSAENFNIYNFGGNHPANNDFVDDHGTPSPLDDTYCGPSGTTPCNWVSTEHPDTDLSDFSHQGQWDSTAIAATGWAVPGGYFSAAQCFSVEGDGCETPTGFPFEDPAIDHTSYGWDTDDFDTDVWMELHQGGGDYYNVYSHSATDGIHSHCPGNITGAVTDWYTLRTNPWAYWDSDTDANNERNPCKYISDDVEDVVSYLTYTRDWFAANAVATLPADLVDDFPDFDVLASEPYDAYDTDRAESPFNHNSQSVHFDRGTSGFGRSYRWGDTTSPTTPYPAKLRILVSPERYNQNFDNLIGGNLNGNDDTVYHEMGHMISQGVDDSRYGFSALNPTASLVLTPWVNDPAVCQMWNGFWFESYPDINAAIVERYRNDHGRVVSANPNAPDEHLPDWPYGEGSGGAGRDPQHPDRNAAFTRSPGSLNDFTVPKLEDDSQAGETEIHRTDGVLNKFFFLVGNDICDIDDGCAAGANGYMNDPCTCATADAAAGDAKCYDPLLNYDRNSPHNDTISPPSSCVLSLSTPGGSGGDGYQQYHFGVKTTSLDRTHLPGGENGRQRLGRLIARMQFDESAGVTEYFADSKTPWDLLTAFFSVLKLDTGYLYPDSYNSSIIGFANARDSVGMWTPLGNYWSGFSTTVMEQGLNAAFVNWRLVESPPAPNDTREKWNSEFVFAFNPTTNRIGLGARRCFASDQNGDDVMDYCFTGSPWATAFVDSPVTIGGLTILKPQSVPAIDVNNADPEGLDAAHGMWLVYRMRNVLAIPAVDQICRKRVPIYPNWGAMSSRQCESTYQTLLRPGVGHYFVKDGTDTVKTKEVVVFADKNDEGRLKSFIWGPSGPVSGTLRPIPPGNGNPCISSSPWRPEVVQHDNKVWTFWTARDGARLCYSRLLHDDTIDPPNQYHWSPAREIGFDEEMETCGGPEVRQLAGPPSAATRNGIIMLAVRDRVVSSGSSWGPWVWTIQLKDLDATGAGGGDGIFEECFGLEECAGRCAADCGARAKWEERSPWLPYAPFYTDANTSEVGALTTTEPLMPIVMDVGNGPRKDFTFFYNPSAYYGDPTAVQSDLAVWARGSW